MRGISELREVGPEKASRRWMDWILARNPAFLARDPDAPIREVFAPDKCCFPSSETVPIDDVEKQAIPGGFGWNRGEEPLDLLLREVGDLPGDVCLGEAHLDCLLLAGSHLDAFTHFRELAIGGIHRQILSQAGRRSREAAVVLWAVFFSFVVSAVQAASLPALFEAASPASGRLRASSTARFTLNRQALRADRFGLAIEGTEFQAVVVDAEGRSDGEARYFFRLEGARGLSVATETRDYTILKLQLPDGSAVKVVAPAFGLATIAPMDLRPVPDSVRQSSANAVFGRRRAALPVLPPKPGIPTARVLFVYPPDVLGQVTAAQFHAEAQAAVDSANAIVRDSGAGDLGKYELASDGVVKGARQGEDDLLYVSTDPEIAALRYAAQADIVGYVPVVASSGDVAYAPRTMDGFTPASGFFVAYLVSFSAAYTTEHEMLHVPGLQHDEKDVAPSQRDDFTSAREHVIPEIHAQGMMGNYVGPYGDELRVYYNRYPRFSNPSPDFTWKGYVTGNANENNVAMFGVGMQFVAHYHEALQMPK